jgi:hypothetical protein
MSTTWVNKNARVQWKDDGTIVIILRRNSCVRLTLLVCPSVTTKLTSDARYLFALCFPEARQISDDVRSERRSAPEPLNRHGGRRSNVRLLHWVLVKSWVLSTWNSKAKFVMRLRNLVIYATTKLRNFQMIRSFEVTNISKIRRLEMVLKDFCSRTLSQWHYDSVRLQKSRSFQVAMWLSLNWRDSLPRYLDQNCDHKFSYEN